MVLFNHELNEFLNKYLNTNDECMNRNYIYQRFDTLFIILKINIIFKLIIETSKSQNLEYLTETNQRREWFNDK